MAKIDTKNLVLHGVGEAFLLSGDYGRCIWRRRFVPDL